MQVLCLTSIEVDGGISALQLSLINPIVNLMIFNIFTSMQYHCVPIQPTAS